MNIDLGMLLPALLGIVGALIVAVPSILAWRVGRENVHLARKREQDAAAQAKQQTEAAAEAVREATRISTEAAEKAARAAELAAANVAQAKLVADAVAEAVTGLSLKVDGRLSELLEVTRQAAISAGRAEGVASEQARTRPAER
jgi:ATP/maltotriose-dependent transcriptional regulator MalT